MKPEDELLIDKNVLYITVPEELLMDCGVIPDTRPRVNASLWWRMRWHIQVARENLARAAFRLIAGYPPMDEE
jgi:hypothetical protein